MMVMASELHNYIGKPVGIMSGFDAFGGELMGAEKLADGLIKAVLFYDDDIDMRTYILTLDPDKTVDIMED